MIETSIYGLRLADCTACQSVYRYVRVEFIGGKTLSLCIACASELLDELNQLPGVIAYRKSHNKE